MTATNMTAKDQALAALVGNAATIVRAALIAIVQDATADVALRKRCLVVSGHLDSIVRAEQRRQLDSLGGTKDDDD